MFFYFCLLQPIVLRAIRREIALGCKEIVRKPIDLKGIGQEIGLVLKEVGRKLV